MLAQRRPLGHLAPLLLTLSPLVLAHGDEHDGGMKMDMGHGSGHGDHSAPLADGAPPSPTYYNHAEYAGWLYAHIGLMTLAWFILLPLAAFISSARSRLAIPIQLAFLAVNGVGIFMSIVYDAKTPDLYPNNAHHKIGWAVTWIAVAWFLLGLLSLFSKPKHHKRPLPHAIQSVTSQNMAEHDHFHGYKFQHAYRWSRDSGHGTESQASPSSASRSASSDSGVQKAEQQQFAPNDYHDGDDVDDNEHDSFLHESAVDRFVSKRIPVMQSGRLATAIGVVHVVLERAQVLLAFLALCTGLITWWGIFAHGGLLNGLAHWIKGGIFFWYGLLTLGRWMGAFTDWGWAWNVRPEYPIVSRLAARVPRAEFVESFVIFVYGGSNVFLEHLSAWGKGWSPMDLEHISITIMFFGGGLLGMLVESKKARQLLNTNIELVQAEVGQSHGLESQKQEEWRAPATYNTSLNPMPALVIFLLGLLMSSHHQASMVSTQVHTQWGTLFAGFALARMFTYLTVLIKPPTSYFPSRPPTELVSAFCLVCGGLVFMASTSDVINMIERNGLHAMFILTVTIGFSCLIMVWAVVLYGIRGWALRREARRT